jgi:4-amino-4-deoxy-L-arabinose transferase-like glycosyltransferase
MLIASILQYLLLALIVNRAIDSKISFSRLLVYFYLIAFSLNIFISQVLSFFSQLNNRYLYFGLQTALVVFLVWFVMHKSRISWTDLLPQNNRPEEKLNFLSVLTVGFASLSFLVLFIIGIQTPPNNLDSLHTHLTRIYYWLQHGNFLSWPALGTAQLYYPINANIQALWLFLFGHNEKLFFLVPWFSLIVIATETYHIGRELKLSPNQSFASCLVLLTIPAVVLQTYSFQNDITVGALIIVFIAFFLTYLHTQKLKYLIISLFGLALSLGVKQTAFMVLPALLLWLLYAALSNKIKKGHLPHLGWLIAFFLLFSSYKYIQNIVEFGSFFGSSDVTAGQKFTLSGLEQKAEYNAPRYLYSFLSVDGLPNSLAVPLTNLKENAFRTMSDKLHLDLENEVFLQPGYDPSEKFSYSAIPPLTEDTSGFGPLSVLLGIAAFFIILLGKNKERKEYLIFTLILSISYFCAILIQRPGWDPYQGRYFILAIIPVLPMAGLCIPQQKGAGITTNVLVITIYLFLAFNILFLNATKPIITASTSVYWQNKYVLTMTDSNKIQRYSKSFLIKATNLLMDSLLQKQSILAIPYYEQLYYSTSYNIAEINFVNDNVLPHQPLYLIISQSPLEYGLFGINQTRELFPITHINEVPIHGILLIEKDRFTSLPGFDLIDSSEKLFLFQREE